MNRHVILEVACLGEAVEADGAHDGEEGVQVTPFVGHQRRELCELLVTMHTLVRLLTWGVMEVDT